MLVYIETFSDGTSETQYNPVFITFSKDSIFDRVKYFNQLTNEDKKEISTPLELVDWRLVYTNKPYITSKKIIFKGTTYM